MRHEDLKILNGSHILKHLSGITARHFYPSNALFYHILILILVSLFAFTRNPDVLLMGNDGATGYSLAKEQLIFFGITPHLHTNLLEGLGNISIPYNLAVQPGYWFSVFINDGPFGMALLYAWFSLQLFISVLLIGWNHGFSKRVTYCSAWLLTLIAFPYFESFRIYPITSSMPNSISIIFVFSLMDIGIQRLGKENWFKTVRHGVFLLLGFTIGLITCPMLLPLLVPVTLLSTLLAFSKVENKLER